tara:strand:+ start:76 stop:696 length:621 start_codon:yes stop_codon:yes gene_type:complete
MSRFKSPSIMKNTISVIVGLGNPEECHRQTLHNSGFWFVDEIAQQYEGIFKYEKRFNADVCKINISNYELRLVKPQTYMNASGYSVQSILNYYKLSPEQLLVAHDEIDLSPDKIRFKIGGGDGGHNGLRDIIKLCGPDFIRLRIGVGHPGNKDEVTKYVLRKAPSDIKAEIRKNIDRAVSIIPVLIDKDLSYAMKALHTGEIINDK